MIRFLRTPVIEWKPRGRPVVPDADQPNAGTSTAEPVTIA